MYEKKLWELNSDNFDETILCSTRKWFLIRNWSIGVQKPNKKNMIFLVLRFITEIPAETILHLKKKKIILYYKTLALGYSAKAENTSTQKTKQNKKIPEIIRSKDLR